jgi:ubiquinone/menaquinone biosynthesis C-methylase UbiE
LVDVQHEMLDNARARIRRAGISNVTFAQAGASALPLARETFDVAFLVAVLGEVPDAAACITQLCGILRRGGLLSIIELKGDPDAMAEGEIASLAKAANLEHSETFTRRFGFTINFRKPG